MSKVNHPAHYNKVPGVECIEVVRHFNFNLGNAMKYIWRCDEKENAIEDLEKAVWYLQDEIQRRKDEMAANTKSADSEGTDWLAVLEGGVPVKRRW